MISICGIFIMKLSYNISYVSSERTVKKKKAGKIDKRKVKAKRVINSIYISLFTLIYYFIFINIY